jgi:hypothetical protein
MVPAARMVQRECPARPAVAGSVPHTPFAPTVRGVTSFLLVMEGLAGVYCPVAASLENRPAAMQ